MKILKHFCCINTLQLETENKSNEIILYIQNSQSNAEGKFQSEGKNIPQNQDMKKISTNLRGSGRIEENKVDTQNKTRKKHNIENIKRKEISASYKERKKTNDLLLNSYINKAKSLIKMKSSDSLPLTTFKTPFSYANRPMRYKTITKESSKQQSYLDLFDNNITDKEEKLSYDLRTPIKTGNISRKWNNFKGNRFIFNPPKQSLTTQPPSHSGNSPRDKVIKDNESWTQSWKASMLTTKLEKLFVNTQIQITPSTTTSLCIDSPQGTRFSYTKSIYSAQKQPSRYRWKKKRTPNRGILCPSVNSTFSFLPTYYNPHKAKEVKLDAELETALIKARDIGKENMRGNTLEFITNSELDMKYPGTIVNPVPPLLLTKCSL